MGLQFWCLGNRLRMKMSNQIGIWVYRSFKKSEQKKKSVLSKM